MYLKFGVVVVLVWFSGSELWRKLFKGSLQADQTEKLLQQPTPTYNNNLQLFFSQFPTLAPTLTPLLTLTPSSVALKLGALNFTNEIKDSPRSRVANTAAK